MYIIGKLFHTSVSIYHEHIYAALAIVQSDELWLLLTIFTGMSEIVMRIKFAQNLTGFASEKRTCVRSLSTRGTSKGRDVLNISSLISRDRIAMV